MVACVILLTELKWRRSRRRYRGARPSPVPAERDLAALTRSRGPHRADERQYLSLQLRGLLRQGTSRVQHLTGGRSGIVGHLSDIGDLDRDLLRPARGLLDAADDLGRGGAL